MTGIQTVNSGIGIILYYLTLMVFLIALSIYDVKHKRVPNVVLACFLPFALLAPIMVGINEGLSIPRISFWLSLFLPSILGAMIGGGTLLFCAVITNGGIGGGDIKLAALLGLVYGPYGILMILMLATPLAMLFGLIKKKATGKRCLNLAFVPFMTIGCCAVTVMKLIN